MARKSRSVTSRRSTARKRNPPTLWVLGIIIVLAIVLGMLVLAAWQLWSEPSASPSATAPTAPIDLPLTSAEQATYPALW